MAMVAAATWDEFTLLCLGQHNGLHERDSFGATLAIRMFRLAAALLLFYDSG